MRWQVTATCCLGGSRANRRIAASCAARAKFYRTRLQQAREELSAALERRPARVVALSRLELPERVVQEMRRVPAMDLCAACHRKLEAVSALGCLFIRRVHVCTARVCVWRAC